MLRGSESHSVESGTLIYKTFIWRRRNGRLFESFVNHVEPFLTLIYMRCICMGMAVEWPTTHHTSTHCVAHERAERQGRSGKTDKCCGTQKTRIPNSKWGMKMAWHRAFHTPHKHATEIICVFRRNCIVLSFSTEYPSNGISRIGSRIVEFT